MNSQKQLQQVKRSFYSCGVLAAVFFLFTVSLKCLDVRPVGADGASVSWASLNMAFFRLFGVHLFWDKVTDGLLAATVLIALGFAAQGAYQLYKTKSIKKVDTTLFALAGAYIITLLCFLFFECIEVNCRPVVINGAAESSFPSTHTLFVCSIMMTAISRFRRILKTEKLCMAVNIVCIAVMFFTALGRLLSGMHWFTDVFGAFLLSVLIYKLYISFYKYILYRRSLNAHRPLQP